MNDAASTLTRSEPAAAAQQRCECGHQIVRDGVIRSRAVKIADGTAKCRCKRWVVIEALRRM